MRSSSSSSSSRTVAYGFTRIATGVVLVLAASSARADEPAVSPAAPTTPPSDADASAVAPNPTPPQTPVTASTPEKEPVPEVRVIGDKADSLPKVPGSGAVIGAKDLRRAQPVETSEMLRRVPGVQAREDPGGGGRFDVSVRGLDAGRSRRVLVLEDGVPVSLNPYSEPDLYFAPAIERYRAIEVVKGSGNVLFGPQTLAGTLNLVTIAPPEHSSAALDLDVGNYGYVRGLGRYGDAVGDTRYVVQILQRHGDGYRGLPFDSTDGLAKIAFPTGERGTATLKLGYRRDDAASDDVGFTSAMFKQDPRRASLSPQSHLVLNRFDASLTHEHRFSNDVSLKTLAYAYRTSRIWRRQDYTRTPRSGDVYERVEGDPSAPNGAIYFRSGNAILDRTYDVGGIEPRLTVRARTGDVKHTFDVGGRVLLETADYQQRTGTYVETYVGSLDNAEKHRGTGLAAYVQDRIAFTDKLLVSPGIRVEHFTYRRTILHTFEGDVPTDVYREGTGDNTGVIPGIGMVYGTRAAHGFFGIHRGYAPPRVTTAISPRGEPARVGADESTNYEIGTRLAPAKWTRFEVAGFMSNFSNQVIANTNPGADVSLVDAGATRLRGVESAATIDVSRPLDWATTVELGARYTYSQAKFRYGRNAGHLLPYAPEHSASANVDVEHPSGFGGQVSYTFVGPQFTDEANTAAEDVTGRIGQIDPWHLLNANVHYKHAPSGITLRLTAKNLLDTVTIAARRPEGIQPGPFRLVMVGLRWDWDEKPRAATTPP